MAFNRGLSEEFIDMLRVEAGKPGWWRDVLADPTLLVGVRESYLSVYWQGQALFTARQVGKTLQVTTHEKFLLDLDLKDQISLKDGSFDVGRLRARGFMSEFEAGQTLRKMKRAAHRFAGDEKRGCHRIAERNAMVVDFEVATPVDADSDDGTSRIDLACFEDSDKGVRLTFWEAKHFANKELRAWVGDAQVVRQVENYSAWITAHRAELEKSYRRIAQNLLAFKAMGWERTLHPSIGAVADGKPLWLEDFPAVGLLLFGYNQAQKVHPDWIEHHKKLVSRIGRIISAGNPAAIRLPAYTTDRPFGDISLPDEFPMSEAMDIAASCETPEGLAELQLAGLARFADTFSAPGFSFGQWSHPGGLADGVIDMPSYCLSDEGHAFYEAVYELGWITRLEWSDWMNTPEATALLATPAGAAAASMEELRRMLTALVRSDRFCEGTLADAFDRGILTAIVQRARVLLSEARGRP